VNGQLFASRPARAILFVLVWAASAWFISDRIDRGWGPPDEGLLGQTAERFFRGEVPHRDFDDLYTGGLTALHGAAFALLGTKMSSLRIVLLGAVVLWIPFVWIIARRFVSPLVAAALTILAVAWSLPAYPAPMPSWYNLFFATVGLWAILRFLDTSRYRWAFVAGVCAGLSMLAKISGMYFLAALLLIVVMRAYLVPTSDALLEGAPIDDAPSAGHGGQSFGPSAGFAAALAFVVAVYTLLAPRGWSEGSWLFLFAPPAMICASLGVIALDSRTAKWSDLWRPTLAVGLGVLVSVAPLVAYFAANGAISDLIQGVFVLPQLRVNFASRAPRLTPFPYALLLMGIVIAGARIRQRRLAAILAIFLAVAGVWILIHGVRLEGPGGVGGVGKVYRQMVGSLSAMMPLVVGAFAWLVATGRARGLPRAQLAATFAVVSVAAFSALLAFPFSNDLYFHYIAPLLALAGVAVMVASGIAVDRRIAGVLAVVYLAFALKHVAMRTTALLAIDRGGIRVPPQDSVEVEEFVRLMRTHARTEYIYATPDAPEAYFLTGLRNPTRMMYEFFDAAPHRTERILAALDTHQVTVVAINQWTIFSGRPDSLMKAALEARYPHSTRAWHFTVRWSNPQ
jgi:hypothetical protein